MQGSYAAELWCLPEKIASLKQYIKSEPNWFHSFHFQEGITTPGRDPSAKKLHHLCLPASLKGKTVIDVGAYEGFFSFQCEKRGAARVVAADQFVWDWPGSSAKHNFDAVHHAIGSRVEPVHTDVEQLSKHVNDKFDVVLFLGVLYHTSDMVGYLQNVANLVKEVLILETLVDALDEDGARAVGYDPGEMNNDATNWWGPNLHAIDLMLKRVGFSNIEFVNLWDVNTRNQLEHKPMFGRIKTGRVVFHAYK